MSNFNTSYPSPPLTSRDLIASYPQRPDLLVCTTSIGGILSHEHYEHAHAFVVKRWKHVPKNRTMKSTADILEYILTLLLEYTSRLGSGRLSPSAPRLAHKLRDMKIQSMPVIREVPIDHRHRRFEAVRDDEHRILGVAMCIGANASRVKDMHVALALKGFPNVPTSAVVASRYLRKAQDIGILNSTQVTEVLSLSSPEEQIRRTAMLSAGNAAYFELRYGKRAGQISSDVAQSSKALWLGRIAEHLRPTVGEEWFSGTMLWVSADGQPTPDRAAVFSTTAEELLEDMDRLAIIRDTSDIPFPQ